LIRLIFKPYIILYIYFKGKVQYSGPWEISTFSFVKKKKKKKITKLLDSSKYVLVDKLFKFRKLLYLSDHIL